MLSDTLSLLGKIKDTLKGYEAKVARLTEEAESAKAALAKASTIVVSEAHMNGKASDPSTPRVSVAKAMSSSSLTMEPESCPMMSFAPEVKSSLWMLPDLSPVIELQALPYVSVQVGTKLLTSSEYILFFLPHLLALHVSIF